MGGSLLSLRKAEAKSFGFFIVCPIRRLAKISLFCLIAHDGSVDQEDVTTGKYTVMEEV